MTSAGKNRIMIYARKLEFSTAEGEALAISVPVGEARVLKHFPGADAVWLFVPDVP